MLRYMLVFDVFFREFPEKLAHLDWLVNQDHQVYRYVCSLIYSSKLTLMLESINRLY